MAYLKDFQITPTIRDELNRAYQGLDSSSFDASELAGRLGVQEPTLQGWLVGRGSPIPKAALGQWAYDGSLQEAWQERVVLGALLLGTVGQAGARGKPGIYRDEVSGGTLFDMIDRAKDYLSKSSGDEYLSQNWRRLTIYDTLEGWVLEVDYARGSSSDE